MRILRSEMTDPTLNGPSEIFTDQHAEIFNNNIEQASLINKSVELPRNIGLFPDMAKEYNIHIDAIAFIKALSDYKTKMKFKLSV